MKLSFGSITLGGGPNYYLDKKIRGLDGGLHNIITDIPRTDYTKRISGYMEPKVRLFSGTLIGDDASDYRERKRVLTNLLNQEFTFTLVDDYGKPGDVTIFATYQFVGTLIEVVANDNDSINANSGTFRIQIYSEDPILSLLPGTDEEITISTLGWTFPLIFPFIFSGSDNSITVINDGGVDAYPIITITGGGTNFTIVAQDTDAENNQFKLNLGLGSGEEVILDPKPSNPIKATKDGASVVGYTNSNFEILAIKPGSNTFTFFVDSDIDLNTKARFQFFSSFIAL